MKKVISVLLSIILILSTVLSGAVVNAATSQVTFTLTAGSAVNVGGTAQVTVTASGTSFMAAVIDLAFDTSALRLTGVSGDASYLQNDTGARVVFMGDSAQSGQIATLTFETLKSGTYSVNASAEEGNVSDANAKELVASFVSANITINCTHQYVFSHIVEPTCKDEGRYVYICNICGEEQPNTQTIPTVPHIAGEERVTKQPDCVNTGLRQTYCAICGGEYGEPAVIPANGHTFGDWMIDEDSTCSKDGVKVHICEVCGAEESESIESADHNDSSWVVIKPADCVNAGTEALVCNICGEQKQTREIPAVNSHDYIWAVTKEATCKEAGEYSEVCRICGDIKQSEPIEKLAHTKGETVIVKADCDTAGSETTYCAVCGEVYESKTIDALGHKYGSLNVSVAPTENTQGSATHTCSVCNHTEEVTLETTNAYLSAENLLVGKIEATKTVKLAISIQNSKLFYAGMFEVHYDKDMLEYVGFESEGIDITVNAATEGKIIVLITADSVLNDGKIIDLQFNAKTKSGASNITIENAKFSDGESDVFFNIENGSFGIKSVIDGDVNGDGEVDSVDFSILKKAVAGVTDIENKDEADINYDGKVNITDLAILKKVVSGIIVLG